MKNFDPSLYFITDSTNYSEEEFLHRVEQALMGGATLLQLREKEKSTREYYRSVIGSDEQDFFEEEEEELYEEDEEGEDDTWQLSL